MARILVLGFKSASGANISVSVNRPADSVTPTAIKSAMTDIIAQNAIGARVTTKSGDKKYELIETISMAKYVTTEDTTYDFE